MIDIYRFAAPTEIKNEAFTIDKIAEKLRDLSSGHDRIILLAKVPKTFLRLLEKGSSASDINYGAIAHKESSRNVASNCDLSFEEIEDSEKLHHQVVRIC